MCGRMDLYFSAGLSSLLVGSGSEVTRADLRLSLPTSPQTQRSFLVLHVRDKGFLMSLTFTSDFLSSGFAAASMIIPDFTVLVP